jgi:hypothetical protein
MINSTTETEKSPAEGLTAEQQERVLAELRWYGHEIAGGGPMIGYALVARRAERRWYKSTLPLLEELGAVYGSNKEAASAIRGKS